MRRGISALLVAVLGCGLAGAPSAGAGGSHRVTVAPTPCQLADHTPAPRPSTGPAAAPGRGRPVLACPRGRAGVLAFLRALPSPAARLLDRAGAGSGDGADQCLPPGLAGGFSWPDVTGDRHDDVMVASWTGCEPAVHLNWTLYDGLTGRRLWAAGTVGYFPFPVPRPDPGGRRNGVLVLDYDDSWINASLATPPQAYHGTAMRLTAFDSRGQRRWHVAVAASVGTDGSYDGPENVTMGALTAPRSVDALWTVVHQPGLGIGVTGLLQSADYTTTYLDGRTGQVSTDPVIHPLPLTPYLPQIVGDVNGDGRDDYVMTGGFFTPVGIEGIDPSGLVIALHSGRDHTTLWSQTYNEFPYAYGSLLPDFDHDQIPDLAFSLIDTSTGEPVTMVVSGADGTRLLRTDGFAVMLARTAAGRLELGIETFGASSTEVSTTVTGVEITGARHHLATLRMRVPSPSGPLSNRGYGAGSSSLGDVDGDRFGDLGLDVLATDGNKVIRQRSAALGSTRWFQRMPVMTDDHSWWPLDNHLRSRYDDLARVLGRDHRLQLLVASRLPLRVDVAATITSPRRLADAGVDVVGRYDGRCRDLLVDVFAKGRLPNSEVYVVDPHSGRVLWRRTIWGRAFPAGISVQPGAGRC